MIPVHSTIPPQRIPVVNYTLIGLNVACFVYATIFAESFEPLVLAYGWVPANFFHTLALGQVPEVIPLVVSMFLHGSWLHLMGNLLFLHIFGGNVEDRLGAIRYGCFYCLGGVVAALTQTCLTPSISTPMIGASGAIAAVAGAYCLFYPAGRVVTVVPLVFAVRVVQVPAVCYLLLWVGAHLLAGVFPLALGSLQAAGGAWGAHLGGFVAGMLCGPLFLLKKRRQLRIRPPRAHSALLWSSR
ncbi:MAG: rhomboid family intramembrane serine protease [Candidatus Binatia bacterium]|nr:rhomboid family intramembrane serine protease [Candidatus Binatia bacterium]